MVKNFEALLTDKSKSIRVIYVSSYIPRHCGIATYTKDLTNAINLLNPYAQAEIMAVKRKGDDLEYPWEVKFKIDQSKPESYYQAANYINRSGADLVCLQHEFGIYGGSGGEYIAQFAESLKIPVVTTLHTVVDNPKSKWGPNSVYGVNLKRLIKKSKVVIVMMEKIKEKLVSAYDIPVEKIVSIPHGTPNLTLSSSEKYKRKRKLTGRMVLGNINLLDPNKGIEYALEAVSLIAQKYPKVLYLVIGRTHPVSLQNHGDTYRHSLKKMIKKLRIEKNVRFINKYLTLDQLIDWLRTIDFYVTPYLNPNQAASGALAYAVGAGKCCISTPYLYAQEVLGTKRGVLVPFKDSKAIAQSVINLWENPDKKIKMEKNAYEFGRLMTWSNVALRYLDLFRVVLRENGFNHKNV